MRPRSAIIGHSQCPDQQPLWLHASTFRGSFASMYASRPPRDPRLKPFIEAFWTSETTLAHQFEQVLPNGRVQLFVNLYEDELRTYGPAGVTRQRSCGTALQGPQLRPVVIDQAEQRAICGVLFAPGGALPCLKIRPSELGEALVSLADIGRRQNGPLRERLLAAGSMYDRLDILEAEFLRPPPSPTTWDEITCAAARLLRSGLSVRQVADQCGSCRRCLVAGSPPSPARRRAHGAAAGGAPDLPRDRPS